MEKNKYILLSFITVLTIYGFFSISNFINIAPIQKEVEEYLVQKKYQPDEKNLINNLEIGVQVKENQTFDGNIKGTYNNPIIPKGFAAINTEESKWENVKEDYINGMVIEDKTDLETSGSQFVWIPVVVGEDEVFEDVFTRENVNYEALPEQTKPRELEEPIKTEVTEIYNSVKNNGGFYIARYEAGKLKEYPIIDGTEKPVSLPNVSVWNNIPWGGSYKDLASDGFMGDDLEDGAVKVSRFMYLKANVGVKSNLVYGVQWDMIIKFINDSEIINEKNIDNNIGLTGISKVKNIYDLNGNVSELTMEASTLGRVLRGGNYKLTDKIRNPQLRYERNFPNQALDEIGFRVALYIV